MSGKKLKIPNNMKTMSDIIERQLFSYSNVFSSFFYYLILYWKLFDASKQHVPCLAHVINLAVQAMLGKGGIEARAPIDAESMDVEDDDD